MGARWIKIRAGGDKSPVTLKRLLRHTGIGLLLLVFLLLGNQSIFAQTAADESAIPNLEVIILLDESGSMWRETDPDDRRGDAVELFVNALGVDASSAEFRTAIITFGTDATLFGDGFIDIKDPVARDQLLTQFRTDRSNTNGWTNVLAALKIGRDTLSDHRDGFKPIVVLITDGTPELIDANDEFPAEKAEFIAEVQAFAASFTQIPATTQTSTCPSNGTGTPIYTVALRNAEAAADYTQEERDLWQAISATTGGGYEEILPANNLEFQVGLQSVFFQLLRDWTCVQVGQPETLFLADGSAETTLSNLPITTQTFFSIASSDPTIQLELRDAEGNVLAEDAATVRVIKSADNQQQTWGISRKADRAGWAGDWTLNFSSENTNSTDSFVIFTPYSVNEDIRINLLSPAASILPLGAEIPIRATIVDSDGVRLPVGSILNPQLQVVTADGTPIVDVPVTVSQASVVEALLPPLPALGSYDILLTADVVVGDERLPLLLRKNVDVATLPYLAVQAPVANGAFAFQQPLKLDTQVMLGIQPLADASAKIEISAELHDPLGNLIEQQTLQPANDLPNHFIAELAAPAQAGNYTLAFNLLTQPLGGQAYTSPTHFVAIQVAPPPPTATPVPTNTPTPTPPPTATPTSTPTPQPTATPRPPLIEQLDIPPAAFLICGILVLLPLLGLVAILFVRNRPNLEGVYLEDLTHASNDVVFGRDIFGRKITVYDHDGSELAKLKFIPSAEGARVDVLSLDPETEFLHSDFPIEVGESCFPDHEEILRIGDLKLQFMNESEYLIDDEIY